MASTDHSHSHHGHGAGHGHGGGPGQVLNHETTDVSLTGITRLAILSFAVIFAVLAMVYVFWGIFIRYSADTRPMEPMAGRKAGEDRLPVGPLVITDESGALRQLRVKEQEHLHHYGWVDKNSGVVRMPIERAIELLAAQPQKFGIETAAPAATAPAAAPATAPAAPKPPAAGGH